MKFWLKVHSQVWEDFGYLKAFDDEKWSKKLFISP